MTVFLSYRWCNWSRRYGGNGFLRPIAFAAEELHGSRCAIGRNGNTAMRAEIDVCPICGAPGAKAELEALARQWFEEYRDREMDAETFGTPVPKVVIQ